MSVDLYSPLVVPHPPAVQFDRSPLRLGIMASGAGAMSRFSIGLVIASGVSIGTLFTLFVVPAIYLLLAHDQAAKAMSPQA